MGSNDLYHKQLAELRNKLEDAREQIKKLTELLTPTVVMFPPNFKLTRCEAIILSALFLTDGACKKERLAFAIANRSHGFKGRQEDCAETIKVHISYLRRKLSALHVQIDSNYGDGYYLTAENKNKVREAIKNNVSLPSRKYLPTKETRGVTSYVA